MIKWSDYEDNGVLFEAFLPSDETEPQEWLLRATRNGILLAERQIALTWIPRFGPDAGDVASLEGALDKMLLELSSGQLDAAATGRKVAIESRHPFIEENSPANAALAHIALSAYAATSTALRLPSDLFRAFAHLPPVPALQALLPMAVSVDMRNRMAAVIAVGELIQELPEVERAHYVNRLRGAMRTNVVANVTAIQEALVSKRAK